MLPTTCLEGSVFKRTAIEELLIQIDKLSVCIESLCRGFHNRLPSEGIETRMRMPLDGEADVD
jgi:hypothetical protein